MLQAFRWDLGIKQVLPVNHKTYLIFFSHFFGILFEVKGYSRHLHCDGTRPGIPNFLAGPLALLAFSMHFLSKCGKSEVQKSKKKDLRQVFAAFSCQIKGKQKRESTIAVQ